MDKTYINFSCNCALPALTGGTECCKHCMNNPNREGYQQQYQLFDTTEFILPGAVINTCNHTPVPQLVYENDKTFVVVMCSTCLKILGIAEIKLDLN
jgi:hypothetical protein